MPRWLNFITIGRCFLDRSGLGSMIGILGLGDYGGTEGGDDFGLEWQQKLNIQLVFYGLDEADIDGAAAAHSARLFQLDSLDQ